MTARVRWLRRGVFAAVAVLTALVLSACAGLPTSGPVNPGIPPGAEPDVPDFSFLPDRPQPGATPEEIVQGFLRAGSGPGPDAEWERARLFLAPAIRDTWKPDASVTITLPGDSEISSPTQNSVGVSVATVATVDATGAYEPAEEGSTTSMSFRLEQQDDGEWRISEAPDGIVLDRDTFPSVFHRYELTYFDPTWQFLVPDVRWFPTHNAATRIATALVNGSPSPWLVGAVADPFPENVTITPSVPTDAGVARVELSANAVAIAPATLNRMQTSLEASLATAGATEVEMFVGTTPLTAEPVQTRSTRVSGAPLVVVDPGFGFLAGDELTPIPGISEAMSTLSPASIQMDPERDAAAVRLTDGSVVRVESSGAVTPVDTRAGLVDPTIDPFGYIWSVPVEQPAALQASSVDSVFTVSAAFASATQVHAMAVSRDGTRLAAVVSSGARTAVWVAGIVRNEDGDPEGLAEPVALGAVPGAAIGLTWADEVTVGVLARATDGPTVVEQLVGGPAAAAAAPGGATSIAGAQPTSSIRLLADDGRLYATRGTNWTQTAVDVRVLATQQGVPQE